MTVTLSQAHNRINTLLDLTNAKLSSARRSSVAFRPEVMLAMEARADALREALACFQDPEPTK